MDLAQKCDYLVKFSHTGHVHVKLPFFVELNRNLELCGVLVGSINEGILKEILAHVGLYG